METSMRLPPLSALSASAQQQQQQAYNGISSPAMHAFSNGPSQPTTPVYLPPLTPRTPSGVNGRPSMMGPSRSYGPPQTQYPPQDDARKRTATAMEAEEASVNGEVPIKREGSEPTDQSFQEDSSNPQDEEAFSTDARGNKKKRKVAASNGKKKVPPHKLSPLQLTAGSNSSHSGGFPAEPSPVSPIVMGFDAAQALQDPTKAPTVRKSLNLMEQQKALIEARKAQASGGTPNQTGSSSRMQQAQQQQLHNYSFRPREEDESREDQAALTLADRRDKARKLTIQTPASMPQPEGMERAGGRTFSSIKSAPIRPTGYQQAVQQTRLSQLHEASTNGPAFERPTGDHLPQEPPPDFIRPMHHPPQQRPPHTAHDFSGSYPPFPNSSRLPPMRDRPLPSAGPSRDPHTERQASKAAFLGLFDTFYDSLADSRVLQVNLEEQIRRSAALLGTLQQSSSVFESLLDKRMAEMCQSLTNDLQVLEGRIERLERSFENNGVDLPPLTPSLAGLPQRSFVTQQREHMDKLARRGSNAGPGTVAEASAAVGARLERLEHLSRDEAGLKLSTHATSNLRGSG